MCRRGGWVLIDILFAMMLLSFMAGVLVVATGSQRTNSRHLADERAACRVAESALTSLQTGHDPAASEGAQLSFHELSSSDQRQGMTWVEVDVAYAGRTATLIGLAPSEAVGRCTGGSR